MTLRAIAGEATDVGLVREGNEDSLVVAPPLYVVADGMGGHLGGEVASALATKTIQDMVTRKGPEALADAVREANLAVYEQQSLDRNLAGMGTTLTGAVLSGETLHIAHVGDSRAYLLHGKELRRLTDDHSMVEEMVRRGDLTEEESRVHPQRSILTRALGIDRDVTVDEVRLPVEAGDRILLCSDGLTALVDDEQIKMLLAAGDEPEPTAHALVTAANEAGGVDNTTVVILDITDDRATDDAATHDEPAKKRKGLFSRKPKS